MQYETIDSDQIGDIMAGRPPREPSDWDSDETGGGAGAGAGAEAEDADSSGSPIGGPAGEH
jgi:cell division protease FtsH